MTGMFQYWPLCKPIPDGWKAVLNSGKPVISRSSHPSILIEKTQTPDDSEKGRI